MLDKSINLLEELNSISKIHTLKRDDIDEIMIEFSRRILVALKIERMSAWLFTDNGNAITSLGEYDLRNHSFKKNTVLTREKHPNYFKAIHENRIVLAENAYEDPQTSEFADDYLGPNDVISLMDIPLRIQGELIGIMCFEKTGRTERKFTVSEQSFAFSLALVFTSNMEARHRRATQHKLETLIKEKEMLITEMNHRIKNNFSILISLLRIKKDQTRSPEIKTILEEYEQRIFSMVKIQDLLFQSSTFTDINISQYLKELVAEFRLTHPELSSKIKAKIDEGSDTLPTKSALHMGLMVTEIFINSIKYSSVAQSNYEFVVQLGANGNGLKLKLGDNSSGFDFNEQLKQNTIGLALIKDLSDNLSKEVKYPSKGNAYYELRMDNATLNTPVKH